MTPRPRYLLDTEVLVRAFRSEGPARELLQRSMIRDVSLLTSSTILEELDEVLARPRLRFSDRDRAAARQVLLRAADDIALFREADAARWVPSDEGDDHVAEAAYRTGADALVTRDGHFADVVNPPFEVIDEAQGCERYRRGVPYGRQFIMTAAERGEQAARLDAIAAKGLGTGVGADAVLREYTDDLDYVSVTTDVRAAVLEPLATAELVWRLAEACGSRLGLEARHGGRFDFVSGVRFDVPPSPLPIAMDVVWFSADTAQVTAITRPDTPTVQELGWADDYRDRFVLAGGVVGRIDVPGPAGEPDIRFVAPISEPLSPTPHMSSPYRVTSGNDTNLEVLSLDATGAQLRLTCWIAGGACAILIGSSLPDDLLQKSFLFADRAAYGAGLPVPRPEVLEACLPSRLHNLIVRW